MYVENSVNIVLIVSSGKNPLNPDRDFIHKLQIKTKEWTIIIFVS